VLFYLCFVYVLSTTREISSERADFLPTEGLHSQHHLQGISRLLDSQFRLLREIGSERADFLPTEGLLSQHHLQGISRLLDSQFRLLREIGSERADFLPTEGLLSQHHLQGISRLLDSQFRLLTENTTGQIKHGGTDKRYTTCMKCSNLKDLV